MKLNAVVCMCHCDDNTNEPSRGSGNKFATIVSGQMKLFSTEHTFNYPWERVSAANWQKYPNEKASHVTNVDYLWRRLDPVTGCLHTGRLITCKQAGPAWATRFLSGRDDGAALAYEESVVDPAGRTFRVTSKNLTLANLISVEETCEYIPSPDNRRTIFKQAAQISVTGWSHFKDYIEEFCVNRFQHNASKGKSALEEALDRICEETKEQLTDILRDATGVPILHEHKDHQASTCPAPAENTITYLD